MNYIKKGMIIATIQISVLSLFINDPSVRLTIDNSIVSVSNCETVCNNIESSNECLAGPNLGPILYGLWKLFFSDVPCGWVIMIIIGIFLFAAFGNNDNSNSNTNTKQ